jgi:pSer/pThr/pTyr-binding forkhead associated (FHA) protein
MPKLVVSRNGNLLASKFIEGTRLTIGRSPDTDVRLEDAAVSKHHAQIEVLGKDYVLRDLGSANGTRVNGHEVTRHLLQHGDLIEILGFEIRYVDHKSVAGGDGDRTMVIEASALAQSAAPGTPRTTMPTRAVDVTFAAGAVRWASGRRTGETVPLMRTLATFGESGGQVIAIFRRPTGFCVAAVEGQAPRVNGRAVGTGWQPLAHGDRVGVGADEIELVVE